MNNYLFISDAAKEVKVESHVLRYWEEELHLPIKRNELGHRYYTEEDVERFKQIKGMKERGLQLKAIKMILKDGKLDVLPVEDTENEKRVQSQGGDYAEDIGEEEQRAMWGGPDAERMESQAQIAPEGRAQETFQRRGYQEEAQERTAEEAWDVQGRSDQERAWSMQGRAGQERAGGTQGRAGQERAGGIQGRAGQERAGGIQGRAGQERAWSAQGKAGQERAGGVQGRAGQERTGAVQGRTGQERMARTYQERMIQGSAGQERMMQGRAMQDRWPQETSGELAIDIIPTREKEPMIQESREDKSKRLQWLLQQLIRQTIQENNGKLCRQIRESVVKELDYQFRMQEERDEARDRMLAQRDEEHYKKMDELLRKKSRGLRRLRQEDGQETKEVEQNRRRSKKMQEESTEQEGLEYINQKGMEEGEQNQEDVDGIEPVQKEEKEKKEKKKRRFF